IGMSCGVSSHALLHLGDRCRSFKIHLHETQGAVEKMVVAVSESWKDKTLAGIDRLGSRTAESSNLLLTANGNNFVFANGKRFSPRLAGIHRVDSGIHYKGVGGSVA